MKVWIIRQPKGTVDGMSLHHYREGEIYDVSTRLAEYLVADGYAAIEMRRGQRSSRTRSNDRRRSRTKRDSAFFQPRGVNRR